MFLVKATHITEIHHKFLEPGHTYMECDRNFALIEKNKKRNPQVFIPDHWRQVIASSCKKFIVHNMTKEMFFSFEGLNKLIKDPKKDTEGRPLKFGDIAHFRYAKDFDSFLFEFKPVLNDIYTFLKCLCGSNLSGRPSLSINGTFTQLHISSVPIKLEKWKNLQTLLDFIPPVYHAFYKNMKHEDATTKNKNKKRVHTSEEAMELGPSAVDPVTEENENEDDVISSDYE
uniref:Uncharacterized protein LOC114330825 n=1 Tax=Diabrotica virgifera virgifera TaxID=50390 RepID=A0A6P7FJA5_DIAVI